MKKKIVLIGLVSMVTMGSIITFIGGCKKEDGDSTAPVITLIDGDIYYVQHDKAYIEPGATANDETDGNIASVTHSGTVDVNTNGTYTVTYTAKDDAGNKATKTRTVYVVDFDGTYTNTEVCDSTGSHTGASGINASNTVANNGMSIGNWALSNNTLVVTFTGNQINAGSQTIGSEAYTWSGTISGTNAIVLNIDYTTTVGGVTNTCSTTYTKQ